MLSSFRYNGDAVLVAKSELREWVLASRMEEVKAITSWGVELERGEPQFMRTRDEDHIIIVCALSAIFQIFI